MSRKHHRGDVFREMHYKQGLPDRYFERFERQKHDCDIKPIYHTPDAWDLEPERDRATAGKTRTEKDTSGKVSAYVLQQF